MGVVLGSGLGDVVERLDVLDSVDYGEVAELHVSTAPGHRGRFVRLQVDGVELIAAQGRLHLYEGLSARDAVAPVRAMARLGVKRLFLTNAAGAIHPNFSLDWMAIQDHLNLTGTTPLLGEPAFIDMTVAYDPALREMLLKAAVETGVPVHEGVYAGLMGPQYETPAEVRMLCILGADAVGMSTVLETIQARALGLEVVGLSCLTNWAAGLSEETLNHEDVMAHGRRAVSQLEALLRGLVRQLQE